VLSHYSAAALWAIVRWDDRHCEVTVIGTRLLRQTGLRVHRTRVLEARDFTHHMGIPVTTPARTLLDLASILTYRSLRRAVRQAQSLRLVNVTQLNETLGRSGRRRGVRTLRQILATGPAPTRSELEDVVLDLIVRGGLAHPDVNRPLLIDGRRVIPDFRWPEQKLIVEADGATWHENALARADDAERQALLEAHGERVVRVTWSQALTQPSKTLARLQSAGVPDPG
jgi:very-short-patch-repair endonuclease